MAIFGNIWEHLETIGIIWQHIGLYDIIWQHLASPSETPKHHLLKIAVNYFTIVERTENINLQEQEELK